MSITAYLPRLGLLERPVRKPRRRAVDEVEWLRQKKVWADLMIKTLRVQLDDAEARHAEVIARIDERHGETVRGLERQLHELQWRLDIACKAETAVAKTQELDADAIRQHCITPVLPLHLSPLASVDPLPAEGVAS